MHYLEMLIKFAKCLSLIFIEAKFYSDGAISAKILRAKLEEILSRKLLKGKLGEYSLTLSSLTKPNLTNRTFLSHTLTLRGLWAHPLTLLNPFSPLFPLLFGLNIGAPFNFIISDIYQK